MHHVDLRPRQELIFARKFLSLVEASSSGSAGVSSDGVSIDGVSVIGDSLDGGVGGYGVSVDGVSIDGVSEIGALWRGAEFPFHQPNLAGLGNKTWMRRFIKKVLVPLTRINLSKI